MVMIESSTALPHFSSHPHAHNIPRDIPIQMTIKPKNPQPPSRKGQQSPTTAACCRVCAIPCKPTMTIEQKNRKFNFCSFKCYSKWNQLSLNSTELVTNHSPSLGKHNKHQA
eukprot:Phypoly_transcript_20410.p2 GENE.Phypoly_transcript_20410~~Phypoly_transcript_20410.p2  ORF type:complete len:112 (+),score=15.48 Phypoly_transcript_20410:338-673(+)